MSRLVVTNYLLAIHPLLLGSGRRRFRGRPGAHELRLVDNRATTGILIARYER